MPAQINTFSLKPQSGLNQMISSIGQLKKLIRH
jgi:hypothetical protein